MNIKNQFTRVSEFNRDVLGISQDGMHSLDEHTFELATVQLQEEIQEFEDAYQLGDFVGQVDAMEDLIYYAYGVLYKMGLEPKTEDAVADTIHACNMQKQPGVNAKRGDHGAVDAIKTGAGPEMAIAEILDAQRVSK